MYKPLPGILMEKGIGRIVSVEIEVSGTYTAHIERGHPAPVPAKSPLKRSQEPQHVAAVAIISYAFPTVQCPVVRGNRTIEAVELVQRIILPGKRRYETHPRDQEFRLVFAIHECLALGIVRGLYMKMMKIARENGWFPAIVIHIDIGAVLQAKV